MQLKIGDKVKFLNETGTGTISRIIDNKLVGVIDEDGFEVPVKKTELLIIDDSSDIQQEVFDGDSASEDTQDRIYEKRSEVDHQQIEETIKDDDEINLLLGFTQFDDKETERRGISLYFINDSNYQVFFTMGTYDGKYCKNIVASQLEDNTKIHIKDIENEEYNDISNLFVQVICYRNHVYKPVNVIEQEVKIQPTKFYQESTFISTEFFQKPAYLVKLSQRSLPPKLTDEEIHKAIKQKEKGFKKVDTIKKKGDKNQVEEIDLHIENLVDDYKDLSNKEILDIQLARFTTTLEGAILSGAKKIIFIHGVGNGRLKHELRKTLDTKYKKLRYQDASFKEYGYGATLVLLK